MIEQHLSQWLEDGTSAATINWAIYRFSGLFSALIKQEEFIKIKPLKGSRTTGITATSYDLPRQIRDQLNAGYSNRR
jgi:hypothetical protein